MLIYMDVQVYGVHQIIDHFNMKYTLEYPLLGTTLRAGLHYGGEGLLSVKNAWPRHGYMRQMVDVPEKN